MARFHRTPVSGYSRSSSALPTKKESLKLNRSVSYKGSCRIENRVRYAFRFVATFHAGKLRPYDMIHVTLSVPRNILDAIDEKVTSIGMTRSCYMA